jgi:hypothetical protein
VISWLQAFAFTFQLVPLQPGQPIPRLVYELRVYSLEERNFGEVLCARSVGLYSCRIQLTHSSKVPGLVTLNP